MTDADRALRAKCLRILRSYCLVPWCSVLGPCPMCSTKADEILALVREEREAAWDKGQITGSHNTPGYRENSELRTLLEQAEAKLAASEKAREEAETALREKCGCRFADDTLIVECVEHREDRESSEAAIKVLHDLREKAERERDEALTTKDMHKERQEQEIKRATAERALADKLAEALKDVTHSCASAGESSFGFFIGYKIVISRDQLELLRSLVAEHAKAREPIVTTPNRKET